VAGLVGSGGGKLWRGLLDGVGRKGNELTGGARESTVERRRGGLTKCATPRRKRNPAITPRRFGPTGPMKEAAPYGGRAGKCG
jgi:hypothetical protein